MQSNLMFLIVFLLLILLIILRKYRVQMTGYERFVPKQFLRNLHKGNIENVKLGDNSEKVMSILFSDIRNFTSLSEKMNPEENFNFINSYLSVMGPVIKKHNGFIDKFIGDAIMALFDKNADDAVKGAIAMLKRLSEYNKGRGRAKYFPVSIGIGINTGTLRIGTVGESDRMEVTVIGDAVNVASRIEGMTKEFGAPLLITDATYNSLSNPSSFDIRKISKVRAKGKEKWITIWEVFDADPPEIIKYKLELSSVFEEAVSLYHEREFNEAYDLFQDCCTRNPQDKPAQHLSEKCKLYMKMGIDDTWDGVTRRIVYERVN